MTQLEVAGYYVFYYSSVLTLQLTFTGLSNPHFPGDFDPMWSKNTKDERVGHIPSLFVPTFNLPTMAPNGK